MSGTREGSKKAIATIREKHGADFFKNIGRKGGIKTAADGVFKGFAVSGKASEAGRKGGLRRKELYDLAKATDSNTETDI